MEDKLWSDPIYPDFRSNSVQSVFTFLRQFKCLRPFHSSRFYNRRNIICSVTQIIKLQLYNFNNFPLVSKHYSDQPHLKATNYDITSGGETKYLLHYQHCNSTLIHVGEKHSAELKKKKRRKDQQVHFGFMNATFITK